MCRDLFVGGWKVEVETDEITGVSAQREFFAGMAKMKMKEEQMYLGDIISADGSHSKNVQHRKNNTMLSSIWNLEYCLCVLKS